ncbi:MAG TPA: 2-hydroxyacid dehydrogenase [Gammaproteobacteria bacterium]
MSGVFLDRDSLDPGDLDLTALQATLPQWRLYGATSAGQVAERIADAQVVVSNKVMLDEAALAAAPRLRLIAIAATGTNNVDLEAAARRGIAVCNVRRYATPSVVQHVFALLLNLTRRLNDYQRAVAQGRWQQSGQFCLLDYPIGELNGRTLGIIGYGELGEAVARVAGQAFGMQVLLAQRPGAPPRQGRLPLGELLPQVDVLSLHCPLTEATRGLIGAAELALMKPGAILINTARGGIVDEQALAEALRAGRLGGAAIDVLEREPPADDNPLLQGDLPNLIVTPHIAWASREARQRLTDQLAQNIRAFLEGRPQNLVSAD